MVSGFPGNGSGDRAGAGSLQDGSVILIYVPRAGD
jgi:hypothetical protein